MNNRRINKSLAVLGLLTALAATGAGGCATDSYSSTFGGENQDLSSAHPSSHASFKEIDLHQRQVGLAVAFLARQDELLAADPHPQDADHHRSYEAVARHMLARSNARLREFGVGLFDGVPSEADAVSRVDIRRVESEYAMQALTLQREVVRIERTCEGEEGMSHPGATHADAAAYDLGLLLTLRNPMVAAPLNSGKRAVAVAGTTVKVAVNPTGGANGVNPPQTEGSGNSQYDEYMKRKGFSSHPGYTPPPK